MSNSKRGRPKGSRNKITNEAKQAIQLAFDRLGGVDGLVEWAEKSDENRTIFYTKLYIRLVPRPALDVPPAPEAKAPVKGVLTWKTPDWAKEYQKQSKAARRGGVSQAASAVVAAAASDGGRRSGEPPPGDWENA